MRDLVRDDTLIDALEALSPTTFSGLVWRVVGEGRDPCQSSASGGRWDDASFEVLYTSMDPDGAIAEMHFHLRQGQPVFPSRAPFRLHRLTAHLGSVLDLSDPAVLSALGIDMARFGQLAYARRQTEYVRTQQVAEVAHFLGHTGIIVPNARFGCKNLVVFSEATVPSPVEPIEDLGLIDWKFWQRTTGRT